MKILQVGTGRWGRNHARVWRELGVDLYLVDTDADCLAEARRLYQVPEERSARDAAAFLGTVDAVDIVTPADSHAALCRAAWEAGRDVFVEKPLAATLAEARDLVALRPARILQVGHILRFHPVTARLRDLLASGELGPVRYVKGHFLGFKRPRADVGVTHTDAIHYFDLLHHLLGREPAAVTAVLADTLGRGLDDVSLVTLEYEDGSLAHIEAGYLVPGARRDLVVCGSEGAAVVDFATREVTLVRQRHLRRNGGWAAEEGERRRLATPEGEPLKLELGAFIESLVTRVPAGADVEAGYRAMRVVEAAHLSARRGRRVLLAEVR